MASSKTTQTRLIESNASVKDKGLASLDVWLAEEGLKLTTAERRDLRENKPFWFKLGRDVVIVKDNRVGNLKQWASAVGLSYASVLTRKARGLSIDEILDPAHRHFIEHSAWSDSRRAKCACQPCKMHTRRVKGKVPLVQIDKTGPIAEKYLTKAAPPGVAQPSEWRLFGAKQYVVRYRGEFRTLRQWAEIVGVPYPTLYARLCTYGFTLSRAMQPDANPILHGTRSAYMYRGCRCDECRQSNTQYHRELARKRKQKARTTRS